MVSALVAVAGLLVGALPVAASAAAPGRPPHADAAGVKVTAGVEVTAGVVVTATVSPTSFTGAGQTLRYSFAVTSLPGPSGPPGIDIDLGHLFDEDAA